MTAGDDLAARIRPLVTGDPRITEKRMFGGLTFLVDGHILAGTKNDGRMLIHVSKQANDRVLARPGASQMTHGGKAMTGFIWVEPGAIAEDDDLKAWIELALKEVEARSAS